MKEIKIQNQLEKTTQKYHPTFKPKQGFFRWLSKELFDYKYNLGIKSYTGSE